MPSPRRGEVWLVDLGMAAKVRPALVISVAADDQDRALATLVAHTTSPRRSRFEVSADGRRCDHERPLVSADVSGTGERPEGTITNWNGSKN
jgi:mRNA-degrading endonuclease toxin of MazEF toxin-antitoxin module